MGLTVSERLRGMSMVTKMGLLFIAFAADFIIFACFAFSTMRHVQVSGPVYKRIVTGKDVIADILPPPKYLVESYLVSLQLLEERDPARVRELEKNASRLRKEYYERQQFWTDELPEGPIRQLMVKESHAPAVRFLHVQEHELIPAIQRGDYAGARMVADGPLRGAYEEHRAAIDRLVALTNESNAEVEKETAQLLRRRMWLMGSLAFGLLLPVVFVASAFVANVRRRIVSLTAAAERLGVGDSRSALAHIARV